MKHSVKHWYIQIPLGKVCREKNCPSGFILSVGDCVCMCAHANIQVALPVFHVSERCTPFFEVWRVSTAWCQTPWETDRLFKNRSFVIGSCYRGDWETASLAAQSVENLPAMQETRGFDPWVEKILWRRKWPVFLLENSLEEELSWLQSMGLQRVGHVWTTDSYSY